MSESESPFRALPAPIQQSLERRGFGALTPIQLAVVSARADGRNLRISSQTGSGKTVALGLALLDALLAEPSEGAELERDAAEPAPSGAAPRGLIIAPTRELAQQVHAELTWLYEGYEDLSVEVATGGTDVRGEQRRLRKRPSVVVGTPGRLLDHVRSGALSLSSVRAVVLDEADQMLDMGFKEELDAIVQALPEQRQSHLVSATFPPLVRRLAERFQGESVLLEGTRLGAANSDIEHHVHVIAERERYAALVNVLLYNVGKRCLVFVQTRNDASEVADRLSQEGLPALHLSGDLPQAQRNRTLAAFKTGTVNVLIATDVAARGLHVDDIAVVVQAELPRDPNVYTHRSGRTGRAGQSGLSISLVTPGERRRAERLLAAAGVDAKWSPPPNAKKILQRVSKEARAALHAKLEQPNASAAALEYANKLLSTYAPAEVVAALLAMAERPLPREPMEVSEVKLEPRELRPSFDRRRAPPDGRPRSRDDEGVRPRAPRAAHGREVAAGKPHGAHPSPRAPRGATSAQRRMPAGLPPRARRTPAPGRRSAESV